MIRRVRDKRGLLQLSKRAKAYHPGQGVYRSSYKNARRLAATETNIAYRTSDYLRWQQMDFIVGVQVCLSNNHTVLLQPGETTSDKTQLRADGTPKANAVRHLVDICDELQGRYPKDFKFTGWHPHCRCHVITILKTEEEMKQDTQRILQGEDPTPDSVNSVDELPPNFTEWVQKRKGKLTNATNPPYFIKDNRAAVNGILGIGNTSAKVAPKKQLSLLEIAEQRHAKRTQEQVDDIKRRYWLRFEPDYLSDEQKAANIEAYLQIEKDLGIKRGKPMTFTEANEMKGNPHYGENEGYRINCQTCVVAHELRLRGFDVSALANTKGSALEKLAMATHTAWQGLNKEDIPIFAKNTLDKRGYIRFPKINWKQVSDATSAPGRYHIAWTWKRKHKGHIITIERLSDGKIRFYDPQTGELDIFSRYKKDIAGDICVYRVDTLAPNTEVVKNVLTKYEAKAVTGEVASGGIGSAFPKARKKEIRNNTKIWVKNNLPKITLPDGTISSRDHIKNITGEIVVNGKFFSEVFAKNIYCDNLAEVMEIAKLYKEWLPTAKYLRIEDGLHHDFQFKVYEAIIKGQKIEIKTKITDAEYLYNLRFI